MYLMLQAIRQIANLSYTWRRIVLDIDPIQLSLYTVTEQQRTLVLAIYTSN